MNNVTRIDEEKVNVVLTRLIEAFQDPKLNRLEILLALSNLLFTIGASIKDYKDPIPSVNEILQQFMTTPHDLGLALMAQGIEMNMQWIPALEKMETDYLDNTKRG